MHLSPPRWVGCAALAAALSASWLSAAAPLTKTSPKSFDLYDEVTDYVRKLVETDKTVAAQWSARAAGARQRTGRVSNGPWVAIQWLTNNFEQNVRTGKDAEYVYLVKQALREAQVDGYVVQDNVVARVTVKLHEDLKENPAKPDEFVTAKAELTLAFDGFVGVDFVPVGAGLSRPPVTKTFTKDYNVFEEVSSLVGKLVEGDERIKFQWDALSAKAREDAGGRFQTGSWIATQWQVPSLEETPTERAADYVFIVRQALREGVRGGYTVSTNVLTRVKAKVRDKLQPASDGKGEPVVSKGELTLTFEGFVEARISDRPAAASATGPSATAPRAPTGPSAGPATGPGASSAPRPPAGPSGPAAGPGASSAQRAPAGPSSGPAAGPSSGPAVGPGAGPAAGPVLTAKFLHSTPGTYGWWVPSKPTELNYDFFPDGRLHIQGPDGEATMWEGRWTLKGDQLTLNNTTLKKSKTVTAAISGQRLLLNGVPYERYKPQ